MMSPEDQGLPKKRSEEDCVAGIPGERPARQNRATLNDFGGKVSKAANPYFFRVMRSQRAVRNRGRFEATLRKHLQHLIGTRSVGRGHYSCNFQPGLVFQSPNSRQGLS